MSGTALGDTPFAKEDVPSDCPRTCSRRARGQPVSSRPSRASTVRARSAIAMGIDGANDPDISESSSDGDGVIVEHSRYRPNIRPSYLLDFEVSNGEKSDSPVPMGSRTIGGYVPVEVGPDAGSLVFPISDENLVFQYEDLRIRGQNAVKAPMLSHWIQGDGSKQTDFGHLAWTIHDISREVDRNVVPKAEVRLIEPEGTEHRKIVQFERPGDLIRHRLKPEEELENAIEYDIDSEDERFIQGCNARVEGAWNLNGDAANAIRPVAGNGASKSVRGPPLVTVDFFEEVVDRLEKESWNLATPLPEDEFDALCCVCGNGDSYDANQIVFCDACNIAVHQDCYGVRWIPAGEWFCRRCEAALNPKCALCYKTGGALKRTACGRWCHVVCALRVPEVQFLHPELMEPATGLDRVPDSRWRLRCVVCHERGACVQCSQRTCAVPFHAWCALQAGLRMPLPDKDNPMMSQFCSRHGPVDRKRLKFFKEKQRHGIPVEGIPRAARKLGVDSVHQLFPLPSVGRETLESIFRYWQAKHGRSGPLLQNARVRVRDTPESLKKAKTVVERRSVQKRIEKEEKRAARLNHRLQDLNKMRYLRLNLEKARLLADLLRRRELVKHRLLQEQMDLLRLVCADPASVGVLDLHLSTQADSASSLGEQAGAMLPVELFPVRLRLRIPKEPGSDLWNVHAVDVPELGRLGDQNQAQIEREAVRVDCDETALDAVFRTSKVVSKHRTAIHESAEVFDRARAVVRERRRSRLGEKGMESMENTDVCTDSPGEVAGTIAKSSEEHSAPNFINMEESEVGR